MDSFEGGFLVQLDANQRPDPCGDHRRRRRDWWLPRKNNEKPSNDKSVLRMALKSRTDPQQVLDIVMRGAGSVAETIRCCRRSASTPTMRPLKRDVARAKQLLAERLQGMASTSTCVRTSRHGTAAVTVMVEQWKDAGIRAKINVMPSTESGRPGPRSVRLHALDAPAVGRHDVQPGLPQRGARNEAALRSESTAATEAQGTLDVDKRRAIMAKLEGIMVEDGPIVQPIWRAIQTGYDSV